MSDPTDPGGVGANAERGRTASRASDTGSPVGSPLTIVLALIAVVAGFLIFRSMDDSAEGSPQQAPEQTVAGDATTQPSGTAGGATTTAAPQSSAPQATDRVTEGATIVVANDSGVDRAATLMSEQLQALGYTMGDPTDANDPNSAETSVYFAAGPAAIQNVARSVARDLGGANVAPMPTPAPVQGGSLGGAQIVVELGDDVAGKSLDDIAPANPGNVTAPAPAGGGGTTPTTAG